ncbi:MAG: hypothetical protein LBQ88_19375 [Treponema sp.]|jgi:TolB-like protein|nr:hypothetical protein [Treponema sp.]
MKRILPPLFALLFIGAAAAQNASKLTLAVLPFSGGAGEDGDAIAELFSFVPELTTIFSLIPRTNINRAIGSEQRFQMASGMTDPDTIAKVGNQLGAQYVVSGNITMLGNQKLLVISILNIEDLRQIAGDIQIYTNIEEIRGKLPGMARNIVAAVRFNVSGLPKLAVTPVRLSGGADPRDADLLAQILAINIIRSGKYAVYPRTSGIEQVQAEYDNQLRGAAEENQAEMYRGDNPYLVLSVTARNLGSINMFNAAVLNLITGIQEGLGRSVEYQNLDDGIRAMETLAQELTGVADIEEPPEPNPSTRFRSAGLSFGSSFAAPWFVVSAHGTLSLLSYTFLEFGLDLGLVHGYEGYEGVSYFSLYPFARFNGFMPFSLGGWSLIGYGGAGMGLMAAFYQDSTLISPALDITAGVRAGKNQHYLGLAWTVRTNFKAVNHKLSAGYSYRFN